MESNINQFEANINNILEQKSLKWIFIGGKGGVGKTTISTSLSILLSKYRQNVLIISTDPAHNLSDAFNQKIGQEPTLIKGFNNLFALELDPSKDQNSQNINKLNDLLGLSNNNNNNNNNNNQNNLDILSNMKYSFPGIDEALNLRYISSLANNEKFDVVIFDTAPTGHTLKFLEMPEIIRKSLDKLLQIKSQYSSLFDSIGNIFGGNINDKFNLFFKAMVELKNSLEKVAEMLKDSEKTSFISVCIPEFLSVYETERLVGELLKNNIDTRNIIVNQVLICENPKCEMCKARDKMQNQYLNRIKEMFDDFHIISVPLQKNEVRGVENLSKFGEYLIKK